MDTNNAFVGEILETGQSAVKNVAKTTVSGTQNFVKSTIGQIIGSTPSDAGTNEANSANQQKMSDDQAKQFLKGLYGKNDSADQEKPFQKNNSSQNPIAQAIGLQPKDPNAGKTPEEIMQMETLRKQLHNDYYQSLVQRPKKEEAVADKIEREDQEEKMKLIETEKEKPSPLPVTVKQGTGEKMVGVSG